MATYYLFKIKLKKLILSDKINTNHSTIFQEDAEERRDFFVIIQCNSLKSIVQQIEKILKGNPSLAKANYHLFQVDISKLRKGVSLGQEKCKLLKKTKDIAPKFGTKFNKDECLLHLTENPTYGGTLEKKGEAVNTILIRGREGDLPIQAIQKLISPSAGDDYRKEFLVHEIVPDESNLFSSLNAKPVPQIHTTLSLNGKDWEETRLANLCWVTSEHPKKARVDIEHEISRYDMEKKWFDPETTASIDYGGGLYSDESDGAETNSSQTSLNDNINVSGTTNDILKRIHASQKGVRRAFWFEGISRSNICEWDISLNFMGSKNVLW